MSKPVVRKSWGMSDRDVPEDISKHLGYYCTRCGDTVSTPTSQCQGVCMTPEDLHQPYLYCICCGKITPPEEMNSQGECCSCHEERYHGVEL